MLLLFSSVACGFGMLSAVRGRKAHVLGWFAVTFALGASFIFFELREFTEMVEAGHSWTRSAFLSSFFTLVGTHGLHVSIGLFWLSVAMFEIYYHGITIMTFRRLVLFSMFWHFLDLIWIFIFTFVYLMGSFSMSHELSLKEAKKEWHGSLNAYLIGFTGSIILTIISFAVVVSEFFSKYDNVHNCRASLSAGYCSASILYASWTRSQTQVGIACLLLYVAGAIDYFGRIVVDYFGLK